MLWGEVDKSVLGREILIEYFLSSLCEALLKIILSSGQKVKISCPNRFVNFTDSG